MAASVFMLAHAAFVLLRPYSFSEGIYGKFFTPCKSIIKHECVYYRWARGRVCLYEAQHLIYMRLMFNLGKLYTRIDRSYWDLKNPLIVAHAYMSIIEMFMCWFGIWLVSNDQKEKDGDDGEDNVLMNNVYMRKWLSRFISQLLLISVFYIFF